MTVRLPAKSPATAIARVLKDLGLKQGHDFRVRGQYERGERIGTHVAVYTRFADQVVADNADLIETKVQQDGGWSFSVSIHFTAGGRMWTWVANYGPRTREADPFAMAEGADGAALDNASRKVAHVTGNRIVGGPAKLSMSEQRAEAKAHGVTPAAHPYDGLVQKTFGTALMWACEQPGRVWFFQNTADSERYTLRGYDGVDRQGWYLTGRGLDRDGVYMGMTLTEAATFSEISIAHHMREAGRVERAGIDWPKGTRVSGLDNRGVVRTGTVNGVDVGMVIEPGHDNYGRTFVGVNWDAPDHPELGHVIRSRPFTDALTRI